MSDVTQILQRAERDDSKAAEELLPLVYAELRQLAAAKMAQEKAGHTLQATALVHEAYVRLVGSSRRGQFMGAWIGMLIKAQSGVHERAGAIAQTTSNPAR